MYPVSDNFIKAIQSSSRSYFWTGEITTKKGQKYTFENKDIVKGSGYITRQCCGNTEIELGTVYAAEMGISLFTDIDRYSLEDGTITLSFHLDVGGHYEVIPMGIFEISEANRSIKTLEIKAYDCMLNFEKNFRNTLSSGTPYDFFSLACENCRVPFAHTRADIEAMPNGKFIYGIYGENDIESWRDLLFYTAQVLGCYCQINRQGQLELRKYGNVPIMQVSDRQRFSSSFSDFITRYTAVNSTNQKTTTAEYYALTPDDGLTMNLGVNPLLQFGLRDTREKIIRNILNDISKVRYVPFDSETIGNPALDIGDVISFSGGHADDFLGGCDGLLIALVAFAAIDYITGLMCAISEKRLNSKIGFKGICRKVLIFTLVGVANIIDVQVIGTGSVLRTAVIFFYLSNEGVSLLENAAHLGLPIPKKLKEILEQLHDRIDEEDDKNDQGN